MTICESKSDIRKRMIKRRNIYAGEEREFAQHDACENLLKFDIIDRAEIVFMFISCKGETDTYRVIQILLEKNKRVAVPKVRGREMDMIEIFSLSELKKGRFGVPEPTGDKILIPGDNIDKSVPVVTPGVAFDKNGGRIGYGAGYYDRYFEKYPNVFKVGFCFEWQIVDDVVVEEHDIPMQYLITNKNVYELTTK